MGKTRDLLKRIRDTKGTFHAKMGIIKNRNDTDLTEAEDIKKRWQDTQKNYTKKIFMTQITTMVRTLTLEPDILECKVKCALGSITSTSFVHSDASQANVTSYSGTSGLGE